MPQIVQVEITQNGSKEVIDLDLDLDSITMRESVVLEESLGGERFDALMKGQTEVRPSLIQAVIYAKLRSLRPDIGKDDFDLDLGKLYDALGGDDAVPKGSGTG